MRTTKYILGMILTAAVLLSGCKYDDAELWEEVNNQASRIAALEEWQKTVNSNISSLQGLVAALENTDYVTGVTPFETPTPGGYKISFTKSETITLYHGTNGIDGKDASAPTISVDAFPEGSGVYYWKINGEWLVADGNKLAVTGENGLTPKVIIGSDGYWYISATGSATGTAPGKGWVSTGVKATSDNGSNTGLFKSVDSSQADFVKFTLTDGSVISLPKYADCGISFTQPGVFTTNASQVISYKLTGSTKASAVWVVNVPDYWDISIDMASQKITVKPPSSFTYDPKKIQPTIFVAEGDRVTAMYRLVLKVINKNVVGGNYYENGVAKGMIYIPVTTPGTGRILYLEEAKLDWATGENKLLQTGCNSYTNGRENMATMARFITENKQSWDNFPAFKWIHAINGSSTQYTSSATGVWYMPSPAELEHLLCAAVYKPLETWGYGGWADNTAGAPTFNPEGNATLDLKTFNDLLKSNNATPLRQDVFARYQSSREYFQGAYNRVWDLDFKDGVYYSTEKGSTYTNLYTRAIMAF